MSDVQHKLPYTSKDPAFVGQLDPPLVGRARTVYERGQMRPSSTA